MKYLFLLFFLLLGIPIFAQKINDAYKLRISETNSAVTIDGLLDEAAWKDAEPARDFFMVGPMDTSFAKVLTEVRMSYDKDYLYISAICYQPNARSYAVESLRRDFAYTKNDNFLLILDPFDDQTNGFTFGVNAAGAQWDGLIFNSNGYDRS